MSIRRLVRRMPVLALALGIPISACDDDQTTAPSESLNDARIRIVWGGVGDVPRPADYDGDGAAEFAVFRPADGGWYISPGCSFDGATCPYSGPTLGVAGDQAVPADYAGTGRARPAVFRPDAQAYWQVAAADCPSGSACPSTAVQWGQTGDVPVAADYDGDGAFEIAIARPTEGYWYISHDNCSWNGGCAISIEPFGQVGDAPAPADYDGDGMAEMAFFRPSTGEWHIALDNCTFASICDVVTVSAGTEEDVPVSADYDGDGVDELAFFRPSEGTWHIADSGCMSASSCSFSVLQWGEGVGEIPVPADYDGDGAVDIAVFRFETDGVWYVR